jgi:hypothetical protein
VTEVRKISTFVGAIAVLAVYAGSLGSSPAFSVAASEGDVLSVVAEASGIPVALVDEVDGAGSYVLIEEDGGVRESPGEELPDELITAVPKPGHEAPGVKPTLEQLEEAEGEIRSTAQGLPDGDGVALLAQLEEIDALAGYSYAYTYVIWPDKKGSTAQAKRYFSTLNKKMNKAFPLKGLPATLKKGATYKLRPGSNPVKVTGLGSDYFTFKSLPGHAEGASKNITFRLKYMKPSYRLSVTASGPAKAWQKNPIGGGANKMFAYTMWSHFACGIREHAVRRPCV